MVVTAAVGAGLGAPAPADGDRPAAAPPIAATVLPAPAPALTVGDVARNDCTAAAVRPLSEQLLAEVNCLRPGTLASLDGIPGVVLGINALPTLDAAAARALAAVATDDDPLILFSTTRALSQQYVYHYWYTHDRCPSVVSLAAPPGRSNHETGSAIDVPAFARWRARLRAHGFRWYGRGDVVHFDFRGHRAARLPRLAVQAFQRLWNRNHPDDRLRVNGRWDAATAARMDRAPAAGFAAGPSCR